MLDAKTKQRINNARQVLVGVVPHPQAQIEQIPPFFRTIFKDAYLPYRDSRVLNLFLTEIEGFSYEHSEKLGDAFEYLLSISGAQADAGQFRTPRHIINFIVEIIAPQKFERILDPARGTAGFLISAYKHIIKHNSSNFNPDKDKLPFVQQGENLFQMSKILRIQ